jgi:H+/Cl- antiporter ClcA
MNKDQKVWLGIGGFLALAMLLFPPWASQFGMGYGFVSEPPHPDATIHFPVLLVQLLAVALGTVLAVVLTGTSGQGAQPRPSDRWTED